MNSFVTKFLPKKLQYQTIKCTTMTHLQSFDLKTFLTPTNVYVENMKYTSENDLKMFSAVFILIELFLYLHI